MQPKSAIGIVSGFAALFTSTLGATAIACTDPTAAAGVTRTAHLSSTLKVGAEPVMNAARLSSYSSFEHHALAALTAKAGDVADDISTAQAKGAPAKVVDRATSARVAALTHLAEAKASLAAADSALAEGRASAAAKHLRLTAGHLRAAAFKLGITRMLVGAAMHAAFTAAKAARVADAKAALASTHLTSFDADPSDFGHHCDGHWGGSHEGDSRWGSHDGFRHDRYHHAWHH